MGTESISGKGKSNVKIIAIIIIKSKAKGNSKRRETREDREFKIMWI